MRFGKLRLFVGVSLVVFIFIIGTVVSLGLMKSSSLAAQANIPGSGALIPAANKNDNVAQTIDSAAAAPVTQPATAAAQNQDVGSSANNNAAADTTPVQTQPVLQRTRYVRVTRAS